MRGSLCWEQRFKAALLSVFLVLAAPWCISAYLGWEQSVHSALALGASANDELTREFIDINAYQSVHFQEEAGVCSFESEQSPRDTLEAMRVGLEKKSWTCVPSGDGASASFYKSEGSYRWAFVSCGQVEGTTVVVCNIPRWS